MANDNGVLFGVGVGPGDPELITLKAMRTIEACPVVATPQTASGATVALDIARAAVDLTDKEILPLRFSMGGEGAQRAARHAQAADSIAERLGRGLDVALLNLGDPSIYATFQRIAAAVRERGYEVRTVPGVPSFCAVAAALGADLTPHMDTPLHIVPATAANTAEVYAWPGTKVLMKAGGQLGELKSDLAHAGALERAAAVTDCGMESERVFSSLADAPEASGYFTTVVVRS
ncbi:precorrin-2 C(20)-methyltransferase [Collinsella tanakaei]|uniref:precorrin-2 C(20)-methyltransferase n=1 Tax=Collinsella tanakaei TaxID=626935 RepID=UPI0025A350AC|nr:precorrin-2 C(20)-methyltransferase [Collinsella tanakaei]MDM8245741.1 precorrin-2 C(20)-methyltransferase [Collinsella tanakaei]